MTIITYSRHPRKSKKPPKPAHEMAEKIIKRTLSGTIPYTVLADAHAFFASQPPQSTMNEVIEYLYTLYPQANCKAYAYTALRGFGLVQYDEASHVYIWNSQVWEEVKKQILKIAKTFL